MRPAMRSAPALARRLRAVKPSATVAISQRAAELEAQGVDVISFSMGEPDFGPPQVVLEAAKRAVDGGASRYTPVRGIKPLLEAICRDSAPRRGGVEHTPDEVVVSAGAKHSLFNLALALYDEGDEIVVPAPYWVSYPEQARIVGARPVIAEPGDGFRLTPEGLKAALTDRTKAVILCSPSNPTGAAYTPEQLRALADVLRDHPCWIITDEIYSQLVYGGFQQKSLVEVAPELKDRLCIVDGVSKTFAMTGWRIGWMLAPAHVAKACEKIQGQSTTNPTAVAQHAALAALECPREPIEAMQRAFDERRRVIVDGLNAIDGIECSLPEGAFYAFPKVSGLFGRRTPGGQTLEDDMHVAEWMLEEARCAVVPGTAFGAPGYVRISYAASTELIRKGLERIGDAVSRLQG